MRQGTVFEDREHQSHRGAVVAAECRMVGMKITAVQDEFQRILFEVMCAFRVFLTDHIHVPLQHDDRGIFITGACGRVDDDIVVFVPACFVPQADGFSIYICGDPVGIAGSARDLADCFKILKKQFRLKAFRHVHEYSSSTESAS